MRAILVAFGFGLAACAAPEIPAERSDAPVSPWTYAASAEALRTASCPDGAAFERAQSLDISAREVARTIARPDDVFDFAGAWHLTADDSNFGGLSGLDVMRSGSLLAVSDAGAFVWIGIDPETGVPDGLGSIAYMRGVDGTFLSGKTLGDAEGLAFQDGLALVSFEREHRIEAFDLEACGAGARAARVAKLPARVDGKRVPSNKGAEALTLLEDGQLRAGYEFRVQGGSPAGLVMTDGALSQIEYSGQPSVYLQTGMDQSDGVTAQLFRAYDPVQGNRNLIYIYGSEGLIEKLELKPPMAVDNFEGIALGQNPQGQLRVWIISDDNFNPDKQRTLLFAFDLNE